MENKEIKISEILKKTRKKISFGTYHSPTTILQKDRVTRKKVNYYCAIGACYSTVKKRTNLGSITNLSQKIINTFPQLNELIPIEVLENKLSTNQKINKESLTEILEFLTRCYNIEDKVRLFNLITTLNDHSHLSFKEISYILEDLGY